jgi:hypothetical protein
MNHQGTTSIRVLDYCSTFQGLKDGAWYAEAATNMVVEIGGPP